MSENTEKGTHKSFHKLPCQEERDILNRNLQSDNGGKTTYDYLKNLEFKDVKK